MRGRIGKNQVVATSKGAKLLCKGVASITKIYLKYMIRKNSNKIPIHTYKDTVCMRLRVRYVGIRFYICKKGKVYTPYMPLFIEDLFVLKYIHTRELI